MKSPRLEFASLQFFELSVAGAAVPSLSTVGAAHPGARSILDAHNCYPYFEWWHDHAQS
jgi:hypothetical protein